jgi:hypothetical protein
MESYLNPMILIPILLFAVGGIGYYVYYKIGKKYPAKKKDGEDKEKAPLYSRFEPIYAQVFDNTLPVPRWYWATLSGHIVEKIVLTHKTLGIQQDTDNGKKAYQLIRTAKEEYHPVGYPRLKDDNPVELNYDTEHPEYEIILQEMLTEEKNFMQKYGQVLWWAAVIGFLIFMMVSNH